MRPTDTPNVVRGMSLALLLLLWALPAAAQGPVAEPDLFLTPDAHQAAVAALAQDGYRVVAEGQRPDAIRLRIEREGRVVVAQDGLDVMLLGPWDMTGDGVGNLVVVAAPDFMRNVEILLLEFGAEGLRAAPEDPARDTELRERLEIGHLLQFVIPADSAVRDWYRDPMDELALEAVEDDSAYPDMTERMAALGYGLLRDEGSLRILRHGVEVWGEQSWMLSVEGPRDFTGDNLPQLLVHAARGRSFRAVTLLQLAAAEVSALWSVEGHVTEMRAVDEELARQMAQGEPLVLPSVAARPGGIRTMDGLFPDPD